MRQRHCAETCRAQRDSLGLLPAAHNHELVRKRNTRDKTVSTVRGLGPESLDKSGLPKCLAVSALF
ncbi:hypothetical protein V8C35DRAFT_300632 [Trichoderma chlorosporum]